MSAGYDNWLATTPEDEDGAASERQLRREAASERALDRELDGDGDTPARGGQRWTAADFAYDPMRRGE